MITLNCHDIQICPKCGWSTSPNVMCFSGMCPNGCKVLLQIAVEDQHGRKWVPFVRADALVDRSPEPYPACPTAVIVLPDKT